MALSIVGGLFVLFAVGAVIGFQRARSRAKASDPAKVVLSEEYRTKNKLLTAHYPSDFAAKHVDDATILISRRVGLADEFLTLGVIPTKKAVTDDVEEFARLMLVSVEKNVTAKGGSSERGKSHEAKCLGKYEGIEYEPNFELPGAGAYVGKACFFEHAKRMYIIRYDVVKTHAKDDVPLLEKIAAATELAD